MSPAGYTDPSSATTSPAAPDSAISAGPSIRAGEEGGLGENLGAPTLRRDHRHARDPAHGGPAGATDR